MSKSGKHSAEPAVFLQCSASYHSEPQCLGLIGLSQGLKVLRLDLLTGAAQRDGIHHASSGVGGLTPRPQQLLGLSDVNLAVLDELVDANMSAAHLALAQFFQQPAGLVDAEVLCNADGHEGRMLLVGQHLANLRHDCAIGLRSLSSPIAQQRA